MIGDDQYDPDHISREGEANKAEGQSIDRFGRVVAQVRGLEADITDAVKRDEAMRRLEQALAQLRRSEGK